jgi:glucosamine--fructose-6-phosphate aminotransferase (isomerizing)
MLTPSDASAMGFFDLAADLRAAGARVLIAGADETGAGLPTLAPDQADADAICLIQSFYAFLLRLAEGRGANVDQPRHLQKVTRTR